MSETEQIEQLRRELTAVRGAVSALAYFVAGVIGTNQTKLVLEELRSADVAQPPPGAAGEGDGDSPRK